MYEEFQSNILTTFIWTNTQIVIDNKTYTWKVRFKDGMTELKSVDKYANILCVKDLAE